MTPAEALPRIVRALDGRRSGRGFSCHCPIHGDAHSSLSVGIGCTGKLLVCCHAGCETSLVIANLKARNLWPEDSPDPGSIALSVADATAYQRKRMAEARQIWAESVPLGLTPGEHYLRIWRAIAAPLPPRIRWHWQRFALVALVTDPLADRAIGVQLTPLDSTTHLRTGGLSCEIRDKRRPETWLLKRRPNPAPRQFIGRTGVVRLLDGPGEIVLGEGVETTLSGAEIVGAKAAWCALSATGLANIRLPATFRAVGLLVDRDAAGEQACRKAAERLSRASPGRRVRFLRPLPGFNDFNDVARARRDDPQEGRRHG